MARTEGVRYQQTCLIDHLISAPCAVVKVSTFSPGCYLQLTMTEEIVMVHIEAHTHMES